MVEAYEADALTMADQAARTAPCKGDTSTSGIPCATCDAPMQPRCVCGVDIDLCSQHGTWFDADELRKVAESMAQARRQQFQRSQGGPGVPGRPGPGPGRNVRAARGASGGVANDDAFFVGLVAADTLDVGGDVAIAGMEAADVGAGALEVAGDVAGAVADGGVDILGGAFELVGGILGGLLDF